MMTNILVVTALMQKYGMFPQLNITPNTLRPKAVASSSLSLNYRLYSQREFRKSYRTARMQVQITVSDLPVPSRNRETARVTRDRELARLQVKG